MPQHKKYIAISSWFCFSREPYRCIYPQWKAGLRGAEWWDSKDMEATFQGCERPSWGENNPQVTEKYVGGLLKLALQCCTHKMHSAVGLTKISREPKIIPIKLTQDNDTNRKLQKPLKRTHEVQFPQPAPTLIRSGHTTAPEHSPMWNNPKLNSACSPALSTSAHLPSPELHQTLLCHLRALQVLFLY